MGQKGTHSISLLNVAHAFLGAGCKDLSAVHLLPLLLTEAQLLMQKTSQYHSKNSQWAASNHQSSVV